jgi:hypothetical protein
MACFREHEQQEVIDLVQQLFVIIAAARARTAVRSNAHMILRDAVVTTLTR